MLFESQMSNIRTIPDKLHKKFHRICLRSEVKKTGGICSCVFSEDQYRELKGDRRYTHKPKICNFTFQSFNKTRDYTELRLGLFAIKIYIPEIPDIYIICIENSCKPQYPIEIMGRVCHKGNVQRYT